MAHHVLRHDTPTVQALGADGPMLDLDHDGSEHDDDDLKADVAPDHGAMAPYVDDDHEPLAPKKRKAPKRRLAKRAKKIAKDIAHKTQVPGVVDPAIQALLDQSLAINNKLIADTQKIVKDNDEKQAKEQLRKSVNDSKAVAYGVELAMYSRSMGGAGSKAFIQRLDSIDDADLRQKVKLQFQLQTGQTLEQFIKSNDEWNNDGANRDQHAALQLIDDKRDAVSEAIRTMDPKVRAAKEEAANDAATEIIGGSVAHDHDDKNQQRILRAMQGQDPIEIEMTRAAVRRLTNNESNLYQTIDNGMHEGNEDEAVAMLAGNRVASARAAFKNERDPARLREVLKQLRPEERYQLVPYGGELVAGLKNPADRDELLALMTNNSTSADAERLGNLLKPPTEGFTKQYGDLSLVAASKDNHERRESSNVLKEFESMSGEEVKAAAAAWDKLHPDRPFRTMIEARWTGDSNSDEKARLLAMVDGDKGKARSVRLQEAMRRGNQAEIEAALAHDKASSDELTSTDPAVRERARAKQAESESFERNNREWSEARQRVNIFSGAAVGDPSKLAGQSTQEQINAHYAAMEQKSLSQSYDEKQLRAVGMIEAADKLRDQARADHVTKTQHNKIAADELIADGKLSKATEVHRAPDAKGRAEVLESITTGAELEKAKADYQKYGKQLLPYVEKPRKEMSAAELMIDNIRLYGVRAERPAQVEYVLQVQQYEKQRSDALENDESSEAGGGSQQWQRQLLAAQANMLQDPKVRVSDPTRVGRKDLGVSFLIGNTANASFDELDRMLPGQGNIDDNGKRLDDGLKDGVSKTEYGMVDKATTESHKVQADAKKRLADRITAMISTIAKLAALLTMNPALIALINLGEGLINIAVKHEVMGESYDSSLDKKMVMFTAMADLAMMGFSKVGSAASKAIQNKALQVAEQKLLHTAENAIAHKVLDEGAEAAIRAARVQAAANLAGSVAQHSISTIGGGIAQGKSDGDIGKEWLAGIAGMSLPGAASSRVKKAIGSGSALQRVVGTVAEAATDIVGNTVAGVAGGQDEGDAAMGAVLDLGKSRAHGYYNDHRETKAKADADARAATEHVESQPHEAASADDSLASHASDEAAATRAVHETVAPEDPHSKPANENEHHVSPRPVIALDENYQPIHAGQPPEAAPISSPAASHRPVDGSIAESSTRKPVPMVGGSTLGSHVSMQGSEMSFRTGANAQGTIERAVQRIQGMDSESRQRITELLSTAKSPTHEALLERAVAAGASIDDIATLHHKLLEASDEEALQEYTGAGIVQMHEHGCVPAAHRIAIADLNPVAAMNMRNRPMEAMEAEGWALARAGGRRGMRKDVAAGKMTDFLDDLASSSGFASELRSKDNYDTPDPSLPDSAGIDATRMKGDPLRDELEAAAGVKYESITEENYGGYAHSDGSFANQAIPHERIRRALEKQQPVLMSYQTSREMRDGVMHSLGHMVTITGVQEHNGYTWYIIADPQNGITKQVRITEIGAMDDVTHLLLPAEELEGEAP